jgi:accessory gene regulator B
MFNIKYLSNNIGKKVASELNFDDDKREVIEYGVFIIIQTIFSISLIMILGKLFNVMIEALIISFIVSLLRKYSGGVHASSAGICTFLGTVVAVGLAILSKISSVVSFYNVVLIGVVVFILSYYIIYKLAPVDSKAKPIKKAERIKMLKKKSMIILSLYLIIVLCNLLGYYYILNKRFIIYTLCIYLGILWQVFTLTKLGHLILNKVDYFLNNLLKNIRRNM